MENNPNDKKARTNLLNKLVFHPDFRKVANDIGKANIKLPEVPIIQHLVEDFSLSSSSQSLTCDIEASTKSKLDAKKGHDFFKGAGIKIFAYDESMNKYVTLEGLASLVSHSVVFLSEEQYIPSNFVTFNFYTRSKTISEDSEYIKNVEDPESEMNKDYHLDRNQFILESIDIPENSIILIDGPLLGGNASSFALKLNKELIKRRIIPIFFVKNSNSDLVVNNLSGLKGKYNSDLHWANENLKKGERSCFFKYTDLINRDNSKIFCYVKSFDVGPQRIEFHPDTYERFKDYMPSIMNMVYYLILLQGDPKNPQVRPIAIAEKYARATLKIINFQKIMRSIPGINPTMNEMRGFTGA